MQFCGCVSACNMFACLWRDAADVADAADAADPEPGAAAVVPPVAVVAPAADGRGQPRGATDSAATKLKKSRAQLQRRKRLRWCLEGYFRHVSLTQAIGVHGILK